MSDQSTLVAAYPEVNAVLQALLEGAQCRGYDEAILLNERGEVSECTSANLFAAFGDTVLTPPLDSGCLPVVTRDVLLRELHVSGYRIAEKTLRLYRSLS